MRRRKEIAETEEGTVEASAKHVAAGKGNKSMRVFGELVTCKVTSFQTGGAYSLFEVATRPGGGPPPHVQHREDEAFYVLEGEYEFLVEGRTFNAGSGSLIYVPKGNLHAYKIAGGGSGKMLLSQTPGGLCERFFEEIGEVTKDGLTAPVPEGPPDIETITRIAAKYGIEMPPSGRPHDRQEPITDRMCPGSGLPAKGSVGGGLERRE
jgi:quercetin dioxygenase-like cupin family protein